MKPVAVSQERPACPSAARGQAMLEVAILGAILIFALATLIRVGLRFNYEQQLQQDGFRAALRTAGFNNLESKIAGSYDYNLIQDRHVPSPSDPFGTAARTRFGASSHLVYGRYLFDIGDKDARIGRQIYAINDQTRDFRYDELYDPKDTGTSDEPPVIAGTVRRTVTAPGAPGPATGAIARTESAGTITTNRTTNVTEEVTTTFNTRNGQETLTSTLINNTGVTWETPR